MFDRASTFADPEIVELLLTQFVPVALDQAYQRRQQDTEGEFYRRIAGQKTNGNFKSTTQGFYIASAAGEMLLYNNNRNPSKLRRLMKQKLREFNARPLEKTTAAKLYAESIDRRYNISAPEGGLVVRVRAKVLGGYGQAQGRWESIFQHALSRDNLWITEKEHRALVRGVVPSTLQMRIARFHLVDNTRGEPPMWKEDEIRKLEMALDNGQLTGQAHLERESGDRGFRAGLRGEVTVEQGRVVRFDMVAVGDFWGEGRYTPGAPSGEFPLAVSFALADGSDVADKIPPQGSRGWLRGYLAKND